MKRKILSFALLLLAGFTTSFAQLVFTVAETSGTMTNLVSPTRLENGGNDDVGSCETPIGFDFLFGGTVYKSFNANCDGFMVLGGNVAQVPFPGWVPMTRQCLAPAPAWVPATCTYTHPVGTANVAPVGNCNNGSAGLPSWYVNNMTTTQYLPMISPLWDDWVTNSSTGMINYQNFGLAPNRSLVVEWINLARWPNYNTAAYSMQVTLYETSNRIDMLYRFEGVTQSVGASIGLRTACPGDQYFLTTAVPVNNVTNPSRTIENRGCIFPGSGKLYRWTPPPAAVIPTNDRLCAVGLGGTLGGACNATQLAYDVSCNAFSTTIFGTTSSTAAVDAVFTNTCLNTTQNDIWFYVDVPIGSTTMVVSTDNSPPATCGNTGGVQFEVYQSTLLAGAAIGCPGNLGVPLVCSDNGGVLNPNNSTTATFTVTANVRYFIRVEGDAALTPDFQICVKDKFNDSPCTAATLTPSASCVPFAGTTVGATPSYLYNAPNGLLNQNPANKQTVNAGLVDGNIYMVANASSVGTTINVGSTTGLVVGAVVTVLSGTGAFVAATTVSSLTPTTFVVSTAPSTVLLTGATINASQSPINDVWFRFTAVAGKDYVIDTYAGTLTNGAMTLYAGTVAACPGIGGNGPLSTGAIQFPNFTAHLPAIGDKVSTSVSALSPDLMPRIVTSGLTGGITYWIRFWNDPSVLTPPLVTSTSGTFSICIYERPTCGVIVTSGCPAAPVYTDNPNGNYNGTLCSTTDPIGLCGEKIPTIGTNFAPLCGDNFNVKAFYGTGGTVATAASVGTLITVNSTAGLMVGDVLNATTSGVGNFGVGNTIATIVNATQFTVTTAPITALASTNAITINSAPLGEAPPNNLFCWNNSLPFPNNNMLLRPLFYRIYPATVVPGYIQMDFDPILSARNQGIRVALYTITGTPSLPNHSCAGLTWNFVPASYVSNVYGALAGVTRYCNSNTNATILTSGITGNPNTAKFTMRWDAGSPSFITAGQVYYLVIDGAGPFSTADRVFFGLTMSGAIVAANGVLAVKLLDFKGKHVDGENMLSWFTGSEQDNDYFVLQRSKDGESFENIAEIKGKGNSSSLSSYQSTDVKPYAGVNYYRLRSVDKQGIGTYSEIIAVYSPTGKRIEFEGVHPNPTSGSVFADFYITDNTTLNVEVRDISGKLVKTYNATVAVGKNSLESDIRELEGGLYFISIRDNQSGEKYTARFVKE